MKTLVVGAGPAGLYAAWRAQARGDEVEVWEADEQIGGWCQTLPWPEAEGAFERGPRNLSWRRGGALDELLKHLALPFEPAPPKPHWILKNGSKHPMPWGLQWMRTELLSRGARLRLLLEPLQRPSPFEESLADFIGRRLGRAFAREILPAVSASLLGVPPDEIDAAVLPALIRMETRGGLARAALKKRDSRIVPSGGMGALTQAMGKGLHVHTLLRAHAMEPLPKGGWKVLGSDVETQADRVYLALPAFEAARLLQPHAALASEELASLRYQSIASWHTRHELAEPQAGFSLLMDPLEAQGLLGCTASPVEAGLQARTAFQENQDVEASEVERFLTDHFALGPARKARLEIAHQALPCPRPGHMSRLREAAENLPRGIQWIGVPRFGAGIVETLEGIRQKV